MNVKIVPYNPGWVSAFDEEAARLKSILGGELTNIFHIGSTSVEGLEAKPVIDILPVVNNIADVDSYNEKLAEIGYTAMGEFGIAGRRYFHKGGEDRTHHVHVFQYDDTYNILRHLSFRSYLSQNPDVKKLYGALKSSLAARFPADIESYCDGKHAFIQAHEAEALKWFWRVYPL